MTHNAASLMHDCAVMSAFNAGIHPRSIETRLHPLGHSGGVWAYIVTSRLREREPLPPEERDKMESMLLDSGIYRRRPDGRMICVFNEAANDD